MLNEIHCDTEVLQLLQISEVEEYLSTSRDSLNNYLKEIKTNIEKQMTTGGLSKKAFEIDGDPILNTATNKTLDQLENLERAFVSLQEKALSSAEEQRKKELVKLQTKVFEKITEINNQIISTQSIIMDIKSLVNPSSTTEYQNKLEILYAMKEKYTTKYQEITSLL